VIDVNDFCRMIKRRLKDFGLALLYSPHSFRVTTLTDLFEPGVSSVDVQHLAGTLIGAPLGFTTAGSARAKEHRGEDFRIGHDWRPLCAISVKD
jgi:hypothetical protein